MTTTSPGVTERHQAPGILLVATLALVLFYHLLRADSVGVYAAGRGWFPLIPARLDPTVHFVGSGLVLGVLPVMAVRWLTRCSFRDLGLGLGRPRLGLAWLAVGLPLALLAGWISAPSPELRAVYPLDPTLTPDLGAMVPHALRQALYFLAWEVLFRGVILFGLRPRIGGPLANVMQTALSVVAHFGRPMPETFAAIPAGLLFGAVDLRVGSVWYVAVIHWAVGVSLDWFILTT